MVARLGLLTLSVILITTLTTDAASAHPGRGDDPRPVIFVHGFSGSGSQFDTPARRFASNGYEPENIEAHEYDSTFVVETTAQIYAKLDERVSRLLSRTRADKVDLAAHSLGTSLMQAYLNSSPARAATVAHYVNLDGATAAALPGGVPTLAIWGEGVQTRAIVGATNVYLPDQSHTQTVTSKESFRAIYRFFNGRDPRSTNVDIEPRPELAGRAVLFPTNVGVPAGRLEVYEVDSRGGHRESRRPVAVFPLSGDGSWGPMRAKPLQRYEFAIVRDGAATHHFYYQALRRTDRLIRLLTSPPGEGLGSRTETSAATTNLNIGRGKEWWGDQAEGSDSLRVNGVDLLNPATAPRTKRVINMFGYDVKLDGVTDLTAPIPFFFAQPFISGVDVRVPAATGGSGTVRITQRQRGGGHLERLNVPNWPSATDRITLQFNDYL
jgi:pimeloyl-ACP methyl ester carboxylesterase